MERSAVDRVLSLIVLGVACLFPRGAHAFVAIEYQNPVERALGLKGMAAVSLLRPASNAGVLWSLEVGQRFHFGIDGLQTTGARAAVRRATWGVSLSSSFLSASVGRLATATLEPCYWTGRLALGVRFITSSLVIDGLQPERMATLGADAIARIAGALHVGYRVDGIGLMGESEPGADTVLYVAFLDGAGGVGKIRVTRGGDVELAVASWIRLAGTIEAAIGYDASSETICSAIALSLTRLSLCVGASMHPVLGVSKSIFLGWGR